MSSYRLEDVTELVKYVLFTDYVSLDIEQKQVAVSAVLIANAESGKTSIIERYYPNNGILYANDITAWGIQHRWLDDMSKGKIRRLLIPDLINPVNRKQETVNSLITFLNSYISWEGVKCIMTYGMQIELDEPVRGSIITTITPQDFNRMAKGLAAIGFLSRLIPITYAYSDATIDIILDSIIEDKKAWDKIKLQLPDKCQPIVFDNNLARLLKPQAKFIGSDAGVYGMRALHALRALCRARALSELRFEVTKDDVDRISELARRFIKYPREVNLEVLKGGN